MTLAPFTATKICTGPAHESPARLPLDETHWYFHRSGPNAGQALARCRACVNWHRLVDKAGPHGTVETRKVAPLVKELVDRCGSTKAVGKLHGISPSALQGILRGDHVRVQKRTVARVVLALAEQRKTDRRNGASPRFLAARKFQAEREEKIIRMAGY